MNLFVGFIYFYLKASHYIENILISFNLLNMILILVLRGQVQNNMSRLLEVKKLLVKKTNLSFLLFVEVSYLSSVLIYRSTKDLIKRVNVDISMTNLPLFCL